MTNNLYWHNNTHILCTKVVMQETSTMQNGSMIKVDTAGEITNLKDGLL